MEKIGQHTLIEASVFKDLPSSAYSLSKLTTLTKNISTKTINIIPALLQPSIEYNFHTSRLLDELGTVIETTITGLNKLIYDSNKELQDIRRIRDEYKPNNSHGFNFFTSISDSFYKENLHSDILKLILDPFTPELGNKKYLEYFLGSLFKLRPDLDLPSLQANTPIIVEREKGRIDILITIGRSAIIVENKINNAKDRNSQLHRYYEYVKSSGNEVAAVVYLPLTYCEPSLDYCKPEYEHLINPVKERLVIFPVISRSSKPSLISLLSGIVEITENQTSKVYLEQYRNLIKHLSRNEMTKGLSKKILTSIFADQEKLEAAKDITGIWNSRNELISEMLRDYILDHSSTFAREDPKQLIFNIDDRIFFAVENDYFGFYKRDDNEWLDEEKQYLEKMLKSTDLVRYWNNKLVDSGDNYVGFYIDFSKINMPLNDFFNLVMEEANSLISKTKPNST